METNNLQALDMLGHIYSEQGDTQKAKGISFMLTMFKLNTTVLTHCLNLVMVVGSLTSPPLSFSACSGAEPGCRPQQVHVPGTDPHRPGGCGLLHQRNRSPAVCIERTDHSESPHPTYTNTQTHSSYGLDGYTPHQVGGNTIVQYQLRFNSHVILCFCTRGCCQTMHQILSFII